MAALKRSLSCLFQRHDPKLRQDDLVPYGLEENLHGKSDADLCGIEALTFLRAEVRVSIRRISNAAKVLGGITGGTT